jgi:hypothetical protein
LVVVVVVVVALAGVFALLKYRDHPEEPLSIVIICIIMIKYYE